MKLKKVAALCAQTGIFHLFDQPNENGEVACQWLGDGYAVYPMAGLPYMDTDNICAMFDITEKKQETMTEIPVETAGANTRKRRRRLTACVQEARVRRDLSGLRQRAEISRRSGHPLAGARCGQRKKGRRDKLCRC